jgi:hypothetical protein
MGACRAARTSGRSCRRSSNLESIEHRSEPGATPRAWSPRRLSTGSSQPITAAGRTRCGAVRTHLCSTENPAARRAEIRPKNVQGVVGPPSRTEMLPRRAHRHVVAATHLEAQTPPAGAGGSTGRVPMVGLGTHGGRNDSSPREGSVVGHERRPHRPVNDWLAPARCACRSSRPGVDPRQGPAHEVGDRAWSPEPQQRSSTRSVGAGQRLRNAPSHR